LKELIARVLWLLNADESRAKIGDLHNLVARIIAAWMAGNDIKSLVSVQLFVSKLDSVPDRNTSKRKS
jgi:hypothetical protein